MMYTESIRKYVFELCISDLLCFVSQNLSARGINSQYLTNSLQLQRLVPYVFRGLRGLLARMHKDQHLLLVLADLLQHLGIADIVHRL